jgi:hypothetical protein
MAGRRSYSLVNEQSEFRWWSTVQRTISPADTRCSSQLSLDEGFGPMFGTCIRFLQYTGRVFGERLMKSATKLPALGVARRSRSCLNAYVVSKGHWLDRSYRTLIPVVWSYRTVVVFIGHITTRWGFAVSLVHRLLVHGRDNLDQLWGIIDGSRGKWRLSLRQLRHKIVPRQYDLTRRATPSSVSISVARPVKVSKLSILQWIVASKCQPRSGII